VVTQDLKNRAPTLIRQRLQNRVHTASVPTRLNTRKGT
jgi:hypothetical protein